jgi:hypothetical protein
MCFIGFNVFHLQMNSDFKIMLGKLPKSCAVAGLEELGILSFDSRFNITHSFPPSLAGLGPPNAALQPRGPLRRLQAPSYAYRSDYFD